MEETLFQKGFFQEAFFCPATIYLEIYICRSASLDRFHLVQDVINHLPNLGVSGAALKLMVQDKLVEHKQYIDKYGQDLSETRNWKWSNPK